MEIILQPSPNFSERNLPEAEDQIDILLLHYTAMKYDPEYTEGTETTKALAKLCKPGVNASAHYLVAEDGTVYQLVNEDKTAWHAGVAYWDGKRNINSRSIGIEIANSGDEPFSSAQIKSVIKLCQDICARYPEITPDRVLAHSDVAPDRKQDPGALFPWDELAGAGIGLYPPKDLPHVKMGKASVMLAAIGYNIRDIETTEVIAAFQRHFRSEVVNGIWDADCAARARWLISQKASRVFDPAPVTVSPK